MKMIQRFPAVALAILAGISCVQAQGTAFTYNGRLNDGGSPANGSYDLHFSLCDAATNGSAIGSLTNTATGVSNGLFTVTLDFGGVFNGSNCWLEIAVRTNGGGDFTVLNPRQPVLPVPYAMCAGSAATANSVSAANIAGTLAMSQLPDTVLTNNQSNVSLNGSFSGSHSGWGYYLMDLNPENFAPGYVKSALNLTNTMNTFSGSFHGSHSGWGFYLTDLNPENFAPGYVKSALNLTNTMNTFSGSFHGSHSGWGFYLMDLNPENFAPGYVKSALNLTNTMNTFNGSFNGMLNGYHSGDGSGLVNVPVDGVTGGLTTQISVLVPGGGTNILCFTNGILRAIQ